MVSGGSLAIQAYGGSLAPLAKDSPGPQPCAGRRSPFLLSSPAPKSLDSCRVYLVKGSSATQTRGGRRSSPAKMNNSNTSTTNPGDVVRALTAMGFISTGEIKLLEEFTTFCMSKRVSSRAESWNNEASNGDYSLKSKLLDSFGHVLHEQVLC